MPIRVILLGLVLSTLSLAEKAGIKLEDVATSGDTSIVIKKGASPESCIQHEVLNGTDEVFGDPEYDRAKAYASWKNACAQWKQSMKEMNKANQIIALNCNSPAAIKEGQTLLFKSTGSYKLKVRVKEPAP